MSTSGAVLDVPETAAEPRRRAKISPLMIGGVIALAVAAYAVRSILHARHHVTTDNAQIDGHITPIASKVQAFVDRVLVEDNQRVKAGDTLAVLDARALQLRLTQAEADYASALASLGSAGRTGAGGAGQHAANDNGAAEAGFRAQLRKRRDNVYTVGQNVTYVGYDAGRCAEADRAEAHANSQCAPAISEPVEDIIPGKRLDQI